MRGICRQAVEVLVKDPDIQSRFGISHYYQLVVCVPLEDTIKLVSQDDEEDPVYFADYPIVVCVRELPKGMPEGSKISEVVQVTGLYFKLYQLQYKEQELTPAQGG